MYLSKVSFQSSDQARLLLAGLGNKGVYSAHQALWQLFTNDEARSFLFREEQDDQGRPVFYVQSENEPEVDSSCFKVQSKRFEPKLYSGQRLSFSLRANPTVTVKNSQGKSHRHDVMMHAKRNAKLEGITDPEEIKELMEQAAQQWLAAPDRLQDWGITLDTLPFIKSYQQHRSRKSSDTTIQFSSVDYEGVLTVQDPDRFIGKLKQGVGKSKALGCGLMLIKPI